MTAWAEHKAARLGCWRGPVAPEPLGGGISNLNFLVEDGGERFVVRIGDDAPEHGVVRERELAASRAAHAAGVAPEVVHHEPGALVVRHVEGRTLTPAAVRERATLERLLPLLRVVHFEIPRHLRGATQVFWPFRAIRDYAVQLADDGSRFAPELPRLLDDAERLEAAIGPLEVVFAHNDLLAANLIDDGERLWLIDWEYGGFNSPLFDLANLATNNDLDAAAEAWLLESYVGGPVGAWLRRAYVAMKAASLLREAMWSMVSERHSTIGFDYVAYSEANLARFEGVYREFRELVTLRAPARLQSSRLQACR